MEIRTVGVVGLGTMGAGIAQECAHHGLQVVGCEIGPEPAADGLRRIAAGYERHLARGRMTAEQRDTALARLRIGTELGDLASCDLVIEAIVEELEPKRELFARLEGICRDDAILATNTSALSVAAIGERVRAGWRVIGLHFFNPAPVLPLVEVVSTGHTDPAVAERAGRFVERLGKRPVQCRDTPGFIVNRILIPLLNDCVRLYEQGGVSAGDLDEAMTAGLNWPIGPLALIDLIGADVHVHASEALHAALGEDRFAPPRSLRQMVEEGRLGRKSGSGFFSYP